ncbi:MAG: GNAT family N-acetyltransferase [Proteobacteria bacterium]|nr:GNAT family N-acetyltransferase [Pseudomonadota bacterium]
MPLSGDLTDITIRPVVSGDLAQLAALIRDLAAYHGEEAATTVDSLKRDLFGWSRCLDGFVATKERELVGYALFYPIYNVQRAERGLDLTHLFVSGNERGQGIGSRLIKAVEAEAKSRACAFVAIGTASENFAAQHFYARRFGKGRQSGPRYRLAV